MPTLPSALALTTIADGSPIIAADHRNNYAAIQTDVNALLTILGAGTNLQVLQSGGGTTVNWGGAYTAYTPAWTSSGTQPAIGNGTIVGRWVQLGKFVHGYALVTMGSTTTFGTGTYSISLPAAAAASMATGVAGTALGNRAGGYVGTPIFATLSTVFIYTPAQPTSVWSPTVPATWANGDTMAINFSYEAA
jgi:hypothetical protein